MSFNVATLEALQAEGLDLAACIRVLSTVEPKADTAAERRRAWDRDRKAEKRAEAKSGGMSGGNPPDPAPNERDNLTPTRMEKTEAKASSKKFPEPAGVTAEQWQAFRKQRKKPLNERSYALLTNKLTELAEDGWPPGDMIDLAIERGWETVFAPRTFQNERSDRDPTTVAVERFLSGGTAHAGTG